MLVSVIIPAHNAEAFLEQTIESVLAQTHSEWQLIIVDDGSTDNTWGLACAHARHNRRIKLVSKANGGLANARNRGLAECDPASDYVAFLDSDDVWEKHALQSLLETLEAMPHAVAASGLSRYVDRDGRHVHPGVLEEWGRQRQGVVAPHLVSWPVDWPTTLAVLSFRNCIQTPGQVLVRCAPLRAAAPFDPAAAPCEDWDMWLRLCQRGPIAFLDSVVLNYRRHGNNMSGDLEWVGRGERYLRNKLLCSRLLSAQERRTVLLANWHWGRCACARRLRTAQECLARRQGGRALHEVARAVVSYGRGWCGLPPG
jgi:glycosyltransferase involved in cell wall biosynthesis